MRIAYLLMIVAVLFPGCKKSDELRPQVDTQSVQQIKTPEQVAILKEILRKNPDNLQGWINLGNMLMDSSNFADAVEAYSKALAMDPKNVDVRVDMGTCLRNTGKPARAVEEYRRAIAINPRHLNAHKNLAVVLAYDMKDNNGAVKALETYLVLAPNAPDTGQVMRMISELKPAKN